MKRTTRRTFLAGAAGAAGLFHVVPRSVLGGPGRKAPSEKVHIAGIGIGGMGFSNLRNVAGENIVALCDVDTRYAAHAFARWPDARRHRDFREMLATQKDIDAVIIATPDHTHAAIAAAALRAGKHVYCQKPLTHDVSEARLLAKLAREAKVATQMGIQGHSGEGARLVCEWIWDGAIGEVRRVDAWCSLSYYPWGHASWSARWSARPKDTPPVPETLDWDLWIGPAPMRPYHPAYHPRVWRCWLDFGSGMMGDRGAHTLDPVFWALKLTAPTTVEASTMGGSAETHPLASIVTYRFPARGGLPPVKLTWYEGLRPPRPEQIPPGGVMGDREGGAVFYGTRGVLTCGTYGNGPRIYPESLMKEVGRPTRRLPRVRGHEQDWLRACRDGKPAGADFAYSGPLTEVCALGNVAKRLGTTIEWDAAKMAATNVPKAADLIRPARRAGWAL